MPSPASDFFGEDFSVKDTMPPPKQEEAKSSNEIVGGALDFFGKNFMASNSPPNAPKAVPKSPVSSKQPQSAEWDQINTRYAQMTDTRNQNQLEILEQELAKETNPKFIASLKREISRVKGK